MKKILLSLICIGCLVGQGYAVEDSSSGANLVAELNKIMSQYETQLKSLQAENNILRNEVAKAGIKIPLSDFS
jgi:cell division protein FtsB